MNDRTVWFILGTLLLLGSCKSPVSPSSSPGGSGPAKITVSFQTGSRTIVPNWSTTVTSYQVALTSHNGYASLTATVTSGSTASFSAVNPGTWDVAVTAYNSATAVGSGSLTGQTATAGASLTWTVSVSGSQTGTGNFSFTFAFPSSTNVNYVAGQLYNLTTGAAVGSSIIPTLTTNGSNLQGTMAQSGIASGSYRLGLTFSRGGAGGTTAGTFSEAVNVWDNVTSDQWLDSSGNLNGMRTFAATDFNSSNANLSNLIVTGTALVLSPGFSSNVFTYTATTGGSTITISPFQSVAGERIQYQVNSGAWTDIGPSSVSGTITLGSSTSIIAIKVTASDQASTATYQVTVTPQTVTLGTGTSVTSGTVTYGVTTTNVPNLTSGVITWYTSSAGTTTTTVPTGITATVSAVTSNAATVTMTAGPTAVAGSYYFTLTEGSGVSAMATLTYSGPPAATPTFGTPSGSGIARTISISCSTSGATIYYTTDGSTPTTSSNVYSSSVTIAGYSVTQTIKAVAAGSGFSVSNVGISTTSIGIPFGSALNLAATVTTLAGSGSSGSANGTGSAATFYYPMGITTDGTNLYVADTDNNEIRQVVIATGAVTTLAGSTAIGSTNGTGSAARFYYPMGITTDGTNLYVSDTDNNEIRRVAIATGVVTTLAGSGSYGSTNGTGSAASFYYPMGITTDGTNLYVADEVNNEIRQVVIATGVVTTLAGSGSYGSVNGTGSAATFDYPMGITTDGTNLYVADEVNNEIRQVVIATGVVTTLAGSTASGSTNGTGTTARFYYPRGITTDGTNLYVADEVNNEIRQVVIATGAVTTLAGSTASGSTNGMGSAARFYYPMGITTDGTNLYVADEYNNEIRKIQ